MAKTQRSALIRWLARIALLSFVLQLSSLGHWSVGPFHVDSMDASHSSHCHGDTSSCGGQPTLVGTLAGVNLTPPTLAPLVTHAASIEERPAEAYVVVPHHPPRS